MTGGIWRKLSSIFFQDDENYLNMEEMNNLSTETPKDIWYEPNLPKMKQPRIRAVPTASETKKDFEIVLIDAMNYNDLESIAINIKKQKVVIVNFMELDNGKVQRMVDFLSGAVFALDGKTKRVSDSTFMFSSSQVDLSGQIMEQNEQKSGKMEEKQRDGG